jgi:hypothetical protein
MFSMHKDKNIFLFKRIYQKNVDMYVNLKLL